MQFAQLGRSGRSSTGALVSNLKAIEYLNLLQYTITVQPRMKDRIINSLLKEMIQMTGILMLADSVFRLFFVAFLRSENIFLTLMFGVTSKIMIMTILNES